MPAEHLIGVLGFNNHQVTEHCLARVRQSGFHGDIVLVDNGSRPPFSTIAERYGCQLIRNDTNRYVNPVWNQLFDICRKRGVRFLTLLNNDSLVKDGYLAEVAEVMERERLALVAPNAIVVPDITTFDGDLSPQYGPPKIDRAAQRDGHLMTIDMPAYLQCRYRIPSRIKVYSGDDWIWGQLRANGFECGRLLNRTCVREMSRTILKTYKSELSPVTEADLRHVFNSPTMTRMLVLAGTLTPDALDVWRPKPSLGGRARHTLTELRDRLQLWR